jgi:hypothetical protein
MRSGRRAKGYRIDQKLRALETLTFGTSELLAIYAAQAMLGSLSGTPLHDDLRAVMLKIRGFLSGRGSSSKAATALGQQIVAWCAACAPSSPGVTPPRSTPMRWRLASTSCMGTLYILGHQP